MDQRPIPLSRLATHKTVRVAGLVVATLLAAFAPTQILAHQFSLSNFGTPFLIFAPYAVVGFVILRRHPANTVGWLLLAVGAGAVASGGGYYAYAVYGVGDRSLPLG